MFLLFACNFSSVITDVSTTFLFLFFMHRLPLISTLFPYTTLFRSGSQMRSWALRTKGLRRPPPTASKPSVAAFADPDRKSTRLNSSHSQNSYAVFCLKKKKQHKITLMKLQLDETVAVGDVIIHMIY